MADELDEPPRDGCLFGTFMWVWSIALGAAVALALVWLVGRA